MVYQFNRWTISLGAQIHALYECMAEKDPACVKRAIEVYEAELQQLYAYAEQHNIDLVEYYHPFTDIEERLLLIRERLQVGIS